MAAEQSPKPEVAANASSLALSPSVRQRLQQLFEHATRCADKKDFDYANDLFTQCVIGDPANLIYLQSYLANLQNKYKNNKKGSKLGALKSTAAKKSVKAALAKEDWRGAIRAGCDVLKLLPWDSTTLIAMSHAAREMAIDECQLYYLRWALNAHPKDPEVNKQAGLALAKMGQFDQAIVCWHRVEEARPGNEEAAKAIAHLTVEKTIHQGGYNREDLGQYGETGDSPSSISKRSAASPKAATSGGSGQTGPAAQPHAESEPEPEPLPIDERLKEAIRSEPAEISNYLELADHYSRHQDYDRAEAVLSEANAASGGGQLGIRERMEDLQLARIRRQLKIAQQRAAQDEDAEDAHQLVHRFKAELAQQELEVYAARSGRNPQSTSLKYELGLRLKKVGKYEQAIQTLQAARDDVRRKAQVFLELGECFQKIEQYKLSMTNYEQAIAAGSDEQDEVRKLALYRAGVLATGLRDLEKAEKHLTELAGIDFGYRDVASRLDKVNRLRNNG